MKNEQIQVENRNYSLLDQPGNFSDYARRVGAQTLENARQAMEAELEVYRLREHGAAVVQLV